MTKYGHIAGQNNLRFISAVFSRTGQIHAEFKALVREQIRHKLIDSEGEPKSSKTRVKFQMDESSKFFDTFFGEPHITLLPIS